MDGTTHGCVVHFIGLHIVKRLMQLTGKNGSALTADGHTKIPLGCHV